MDIRFEVDETKKEVLILDIGSGNVIGRIFTPSGTTREMPNAIQVCGFDDLFSYWFCGVFGDGKGNPKKDIQILFKENSKMERAKFEIGTEWCGRCFRLKKDCRCKDLKLKEIKELMLDKIKNDK